jgi:hypothetical protein
VNVRVSFTIVVVSSFVEVDVAGEDMIVSRYDIEISITKPVKQPAGSRKTIFASASLELY